MDANDLRIGNLITRKDLGTGETRIETVLELRKDKVFTSGPLTVICDYDDIHPFPLTEEWLLKFGFVKDYYRINDMTVLDRFIEDDIWRLEEEIHLYCKGGVWWLMDEYDSLLSFKREMKGINDLQNLFFALKGKELTINN